MRKTLAALLALPLLGLAVPAASAAPLDSWNCGGGGAYLSNTYGTISNNGVALLLASSGDEFCWVAAPGGYFYILDSSYGNDRVTVDHGTSTVYLSPNSYPASQEWETLSTLNGSHTEIYNNYVNMSIAGESSGLVHMAAALPNGSATEDWSWQYLP